MAQIDQKIRSYEAEARIAQKLKAVEVLRRRSVMRDDLTERFIVKELSADTLAKRVFESKNREIRIEVPDVSHCAGGFEKKWEFAALHPLLKKHIRTLSERKFHIEVFNRYNMVETKLGADGEVIKVYREDPSCLLVICHGSNPYKYVPDFTAGLGAGALAGVVTFIVMFFLVSLSPQWAFLLGLAVFLGMMPAIAFARKRRLRTI